MVQIPGGVHSAVQIPGVYTVQSDTRGVHSKVQNQGCTQYSSDPRGVHSTVQIPGVFTIQFRYQGCTHVH